jgi:hypothetical protein
MRSVSAAWLALIFVVGCSGKAPAKMPGMPGGGGGTGGSGMGGEPGDGGAPPDGYFAPSTISVSGAVLEFAGGKPISGAATLATAQLSPPPALSINGADFTINAVPAFSVFYLIAGSPPDHRLTYNAPTVVKAEPLSNVNVYSVADAYLTQLRTAFNVTAQSGTATVLVHVIDGNGKAEAGIAGAALVPSLAGLKGPFYLDANLQPAATAKATSASGWLVYFDAAPGTLTLGAGSGYSVLAADTPTAADAVSLVEATVVPANTLPGAPPPASISFQQAVVPIFMSRGCYNCHSGNGPGRRLGDLVLDGPPMKIWTALVQTVSPNFNTPRIDLKDPANSLVLTMPSYANPPDGHPVVVFTSSNDPDYQEILTWIDEGAQFN